MYAYCNGDPVNLWDPSGMSASIALPRIITENPVAAGAVGAAIVAMGPAAILVALAVAGTYIAYDMQIQELNSTKNPADTNACWPTHVLGGIECICYCVNAFICFFLMPKLYI